MLACIKQVLHEIVETGGSVFFFTRFKLFGTYSLKFCLHEICSFNVICIYSNFIQDKIYEIVKDAVTIVCKFLTEALYLSIYLIKKLIMFLDSFVLF